MRLNIDTRLWPIEGKRDFFIEDNYSALSERTALYVATKLNDIIGKKGYVNFTPSSGRSPVGTYRYLCNLYSDKVDWSRVHVIQMDEYSGVGLNDENSFSYFLQKELIRPLGINKFHHFFNDSGESIFSLDQYENYIRDLGGIDLILHGIGENGHIGFNEPGSSINSFTRLVRLEDSTLLANFSSPLMDSRRQYGTGVTLGLKILIEAQHAILIASGERKAPAICKFLSTDLSDDFPASSLKRNANLTLIVDSDAFSASKLTFSSE